MRGHGRFSQTWSQIFCMQEEVEIILIRIYLLHYKDMNLFSINFNYYCGLVIVYFMVRDSSKAPSNFYLQFNKFVYCIIIITFHSFINDLSRSLQ